MPSHWMPLYTGDYLKDTQRLSQGEHGAYILLILEYWNTGRPLPLSEKECNCIAKAFSEEERQNVGKILSLFFTKKSTGFHHKRIEKELKKNKEVSLKRKQAADKRWDANAYANNDANSMRSQPQLQPPSQLQLQNTPPNPQPGERRDKPGACVSFEKFWAEYPKKTAKNLCIGIWSRKGLGQHIDAILAGLIAHKASDQWRRGIIPNPSTFLNQERWLDEFGGVPPKSPTPPRGDIHDNGGTRWTLLRNYENIIHRYDRNVIATADVQTDPHSTIVMYNGKILDVCEYDPVQEAVAL